MVGATVLLQSNGTTIATTTTDEDGEFGFQKVAPGTYISKRVGRVKVGGV